MIEAIGERLQKIAYRRAIRTLILNEFCHTSLLTLFLTYVRD